MAHIPLGSPIGVGRTAALYAWDEGRVLKLLLPGISSRGLAEHELRQAQAVWSAGIAAPRAYELVEIDGRFGIIYERIDGQNLMDTLMKQPWTAIQAARQMAEIHAAMHTAEIADPASLPDLHERTARRIQTCALLEGGLKDHLLARLRTLPRGASVCHGDFHPLNILIGPNGPAVIDWMDAAVGAPLADVARTLLLLDSGPRSLAGLPGRVAALMVGVMRKAYLRRYCELREVDRAELDAWRPVLAGARLIENLPAEERVLIGIAKRIESEPEFHPARAVEP